jgi:hypothetical protein
VPHEEDAGKKTQSKKTQKEKTQEENPAGDAGFRNAEDDSLLNGQLDDHRVNTSLTSRTPEGLKESSKSNGAAAASEEEARRWAAIGLAQRRGAWRT